MQEVESDFVADWIVLLRAELLAAGYDVGPSDHPDLIAIKYFNVRHRVIVPRPRAVLVSRELSCPGALLPVFEKLKTMITKGENINGYQSTRLLDAEYNDRLFSDWGIQHLHFGATAHPRFPGFVNRTTPLLFARFADDTAFLIAVGAHGDWSRQRLIGVIHDNWPESIEPYRLKGVLGLSVELPDEDIARLRKASINSAVDLGNGIVYSAIGGGYSASGTSAEVVTAMNHHLERIQDLERRVRESSATIRVGIADAGKDVPTRLSMRLVMRPQGAYALEEHSGTAFFLGHLWTSDNTTDVQRM